jgi:starch-binding outer membrane protein, SusD/RagB family
MKINKKIFIIAMLPAFVVMSCKKDLNVGNPNQPTIEANVKTETGLIGLTVGAVYTNGIGNSSLGWLGNSYASLPYGFSELLGDMVSAEAANQIVNIINIPDYYILDNGTKVINSAPMRTVLRTNNTRPATSQGNNPFFYIWSACYSLNNACNIVLSKVDAVSYTGNAEVKKNTIKAFCYFWKGWAYANIGTQYYAGLISNTPTSTNGDYKIHDDIIAESNTNFKQAATILAAIPSGDADYTSVMGQLIPSMCQVGNGGVPSTAQFIRNINTMLARNILMNKLSPFVNNNPAATITGSSMSAMTAADWANVLTLAGNGIKQGDIVFTGRSASVNGFMGTSGGSVAAQSTGPSSPATFKIGMRFIQNFKTGDKRFTNNFALNPYGMVATFSTKYKQLDGGNGVSGVYVYGYKQTVGAYEAYLAGSYEENALMLAEANIRTGNIETGLDFVDAVRANMGAGISPVKGTGLNLTQALTELTKERRVALVYRGLSYWDSRRWGWIYDISKGGGVYGQTDLDGTTLNTNVTINYNFLDYWDVPADEFDLNPPAAGSAKIVNPN